MLHSKPELRSVGKVWVLPVPVMLLVLEYVTFQSLWVHILLSYKGKAAPSTDVLVSAELIGSFMQAARTQLNPLNFTELVRNTLYKKDSLWSYF